MMIDCLDLNTIINITNIDRVISCDDFWVDEKQFIINNKKAAFNTVIDLVDDSLKPSLLTYVDQMKYLESSTLELKFDEKISKMSRIELNEIEKFNLMLVQALESIKNDIEALNTIERIAELHNLKMLKIGKITDIDSKEVTNAIVTIDIFDDGKNTLIDKLEYFCNILRNEKITSERLMELNLIFCILSHDKNSIIELENHNSKLKFIDNLSNSKEYTLDDLILYNCMLVPLSKQNLTIDSFQKSIGEGIFSYEYTKEMLQRKKMYASSLKTIVFTDTNSLDSAILESYIEGTCIHDYINRKIDASYYKSQYELYKEFQDHSNSLKALEIATHKKFFNDNSTDFDEKKYNQKVHKLKLDDYRNSKIDSSRSNLSSHLLVDYSVNKKYCNPDFGDLFHIHSNNGDSYYAVLVSMPCDNSIRLPLNISKGYTAQRNNTIFELVKLSETKPDEKKNFASLIYPINHGSRSIMFVSSKDMIQLPLFLIDFCTLDSEGKFPQLNSNLEVDMEDNITAFKFKSHLSYQYYRNLNYNTKLELKAIEKEVSIFVPNKRSASKDPKYSKFKNKNVRMVLNSHFSRIYRVSFENSRFRIERVGRLRSDIAYTVLREFTSNLLRVGLEPTLPGEN